MAFLGPIDMVEEDAADLQFPKGMQCLETLRTDTGAIINLSPSKKIVNKRSFALNDMKNSNEELFSLEECVICECKLSEPYIKCADCNCLLCMKCFANGREKFQHYNYHNYIIVRDDVQVFADGSGWTAHEERLLLNTLRYQGYGNWEAVAQALDFKRSPNECQEHYHNCYFGGIFERLLGLTHASETYFPERMPYVTKMLSIDPPRQDDTLSVQFQMMSGYRCARGDFDTPFDHTAECLLNVIQESDNDELVDNKTNNVYNIVENELKCSLVNAYNHRLKERKKRYKIIRDHGLIVPNRTLSWISKYTDAFGSEANCGRFLSFMQLMTPIEYDKLVESLNYFKQLQKAILRLYEARQNGVRSLEGCSIYFISKQRRQMYNNQRSKNDLHRQLFEWRKLIPNENLNIAGQFNISTLTQALPRKKPGPMDIIGLPGYIKLNDAERKLCSVERLVPQAFLNYKALLISENVKIGQLRLADARRLIKIDVNKTRKIYDFLIEHGHINKAK